MEVVGTAECWDIVIARFSQVLQQDHMTQLRQCSAVAREAQNHRSGTDDNPTGRFPVDELQVVTPSGLMA